VACALAMSTDLLQFVPLTAPALRGRVAQK
jgi:hypothetical protein